MIEFDIIADWALNRSCNFTCPYCFVSAREKRRASNKGHDVREIVSAFNNSGKTWLVHMSGGEPFLHPDFIGLCKGLTEKHFISVNTNLSSGLVQSQGHGVRLVSCNSSASEEAGNPGTAFPSAFLA